MLHAHCFLAWNAADTTVSVQLRGQAKQCLLQHDFEKARALLTEALQLTPDSYKLYRLRSVALACMQQYQESLAVRPAVVCSMLCSDLVVQQCLAVHFPVKACSAVLTCNLWSASVCAPVPCSALALDFGSSHLFCLLWVPNAVDAAAGC